MAVPTTCCKLTQIWRNKCTLRIWKFPHILASLVFTAFRITHFCISYREHYPEGNQGYNHLNMWTYIYMFMIHMHTTIVHLYTYKVLFSFTTMHCILLLMGSSQWVKSHKRIFTWRNRNIQDKGHNVLIMRDLTNLKMVKGKPE